MGKNPRDIILSTKSKSLSNAYSIILFSWRQNICKIFFFGIQTYSVKLCAHMLSCVWLCNSMDYSPPGLFFTEFSRQEYWSGLPFCSPGDLPDPGIEPVSPASPNLQADSLPLLSPGKPQWNYRVKQSINRHFL